MRLIHSVCLIINIRLSFTTVCSDSSIGVANPPASFIGSTDGVPNTAYVMTDASVQFTCCGRIKTWKFYASNAGTLKLQIWRLVLGSTYKLVGENSFVIPPDATSQEIHYEVAETDRIQFITNDYIGWYSSGNSMIPYSGSSGPDKTYYSSTAVTPGNDYRFTTWHDNRFYAIIADVTSNEQPYFDNMPTKIHVYDHLPVGTPVLTLEPVDTTDDDITVSIQSTSTYFEIDSTTYEVKVKAALSTTTTFTEMITPKIVDSCPETTLETLSIFIENQKAIITSLPSSIEISETANSERLLHTVTVVDNETLSCVLDGVQPATTVFQVKETSAGSGVYGVYYVPVSSTSFDFDYDSTVRYDITVTCTDRRVSSEAGHLMVYILKNTPPQFTNLPAEKVLPQQTTAAGTAIQVSVTDTDSTSLTYTIVCDPVGCPLSISSGGLLTTTADLSTIQIPAYDVYVTVNDGHTSVGQKSLSIHVCNINDIPEFANYQLDSKIGVEENIAIGTTIFTYSTTDLDICNSDTVTYGWSSTPSPGSTYFSLDSSNGEITTALDMDFDTLANTNFVFSVEATDGKDTATTTVTISIVNVNEAPSFTSSSYIINDVEGLAEKLLSSASIAASDPDDGDILKFTMDCNGYNTTYFEMDEDTGNVYFGRDFDTDIGHPPVSGCNVTVKDVGGLTDTGFLTINIADTNDFTPSFDLDIYTVFLLPSETVGTIIGNFTATDKDISTTWSTLVYALNQTSLGGEYFSIDENGTTTIAKDTSTVFTYGQKVSFSMTATDGGGLVGTATLLLVFPETSTTSTTTTDLPFEIDNYPDNGYWISLAGIVVLMNIAMCLFLCYYYCECRTTNIGDIKTEEKKKAERLKTMEQRKAKARLTFLPTNDPWSVNIHDNYSKRDDNKLQKQSASMNKPTTTVNRSTERKKSQDDIHSTRTSQVKQSETSINSSKADVQNTDRSSADLFPSNQKYQPQYHHIYRPNSGTTTQETKALW